IRTGGTTRALAWGHVRGLHFARQPVEPRTTDGEHVRLTFRSAAREADQIEGVLRSLDDRRATLSHPVLREVVVERGRLVRLRGVFHGSRLEIDTEPHHLGDPDHLSATLFPRRAEATELQRAFRLSATPAAARLVLDVTDLRGDGRLELLVNE